MIPDRDLARRRLIARLEELNARIGRIEEQESQPLDDDFAEQVVAREDDEAMDALEHSALVEMALTREALARLDAGDYGQCIACGEAIAPERLEAIPAALQCIRCASDATSSEARR